MLRKRYVIIKRDFPRSTWQCEDLDKICNDYRDCTDCEKKDLKCENVPKAGGGEEKRCKSFNRNERAHSYPGKQTEGVNIFSKIWDI